MMNIGKIQAELRKIGSRSSKEHEETKSKKNGGSEIEKAGAKNPIPNRFLKAAGEREKRIYIQFLAAAADLEKDNTEDKLIYICRVVSGAGIKNWGIEKILSLGKKFDKSLFGEAAGLFQNLKYNLLKDILVITGLNGEAADREKAFTAKAARIMKCSRDDMAVISSVAECITEGNFDKLDGLNDVYVKSNKWVGVFTELIPEKWLIERRNPRRYPMFSFKYDNYKAEIGEYVKKDSYIADIFSWGRGKAYAGESGILLEKSPDFINIGSPFDDIEKFNEWSRKTRGGTEL